jgi:hypothetical protein
MGPRVTSLVARSLRGRCTQHLRQKAPSWGRNLTNNIGVFSCIVYREMGDLLYNRWRCKRSDQKTSERHFSSVDAPLRKRSCTFFYRIYPKENIVYTGVLQISYGEKRSRTLRLMQDGISFDEILPKQVGYFFLTSALLSTKQKLFTNKCTGKGRYCLWLCLHTLYITSMH